MMHPSSPHPAPPSRRAIRPVCPRTHDSPAPHTSLLALPRVLESTGLLPPFAESRCGVDESALSDSFEDCRTLVAHFDELPEAQARVSGHGTRSNTSKVVCASLMFRHAEAAICARSGSRSCSSRPPRSGSFPPHAGAAVSSYAQAASTEALRSLRWLLPTTTPRRSSTESLAEQAAMLSCNAFELTDRRTGEAIGEGLFPSLALCLNHRRGTAETEPPLPRADLCQHGTA